MKLASLLFAILGVAGVTASSGTLPPSPSKPLSEVLQSLEAAGYRDVTDVDFEHGRWEIDALYNGQPVEVSVDAQNPQMAFEEPDDRHDVLPTGAKPLATIVKQLEADGYLAIDEVDLEIGGWKIEATRDGQRQQLLVDTQTGQLRSSKLNY